MKLDFNTQFARALSLMENTDKNLFITGRAGTGKSTLLDYFRQHTAKQLAVLAPTGVAAVNIRGETVHSFFRFKPDITVTKAKKLAKKIFRTKRRKLYQKIMVILVDEVSMMRADLMDCVDIFLKTILNNPLPFGGKQMVFIGDLYQLPPVLKGKENRTFSQVYTTPYFFSARALIGLPLEYLELEKIYRQKDPVFIALLNAIRDRAIDEGQLAMINQRVKKSCPPNCIFLTGLNREADKVNEKNLALLPGKKHIYYGEISGTFTERSLPTAAVLELKKDARVMLLNNDRSGRWINGTLGVVTALHKDSVTVRLDTGQSHKIKPFVWEIIENYYDPKAKSIQTRTLGSFTQLPLRLAWALTIHKSQGKTFDQIVVDLKTGIFAPGQLYVALSRSRTLQGVLLTTPVRPHHIRLDYRIVRFLTDFQYRLSEKKLPLSEKEKIVKEAIAAKQILQITYLKTNNQKSRRRILPKHLGEMEYAGKEFYGLEAFCYKRGENRIFKLERVLTLKLTD